MPLTQINLNATETKALNKYRKEHRWTKQNAIKEIVLSQLKADGFLKAK